jgi:hypothetical protein
MWKTNPLLNPRYDNERRLKMARLVVCGDSFGKVGKMYGISPTACCHIVRRTLQLLSVAHKWDDPADHSHNDIKDVRKNANYWLPKIDQTLATTEAKPPRS